MEVILVKPVRKLGKIGEVVNVKNGFGRNFLIPQGIAIRATASNREKLESEKSVYEAKNIEAKIAASNILKEIEGKDLVFIRQSSDDKRLFGSVSNKEIAKELEKHSTSPIPYTAIMIETPIKTLGLFSVDVMLHPEVTTKTNIIVVRTESEAVDILRSLKNPENDPKEGDDQEAA